MRSFATKMFVALLALAALTTFAAAQADVIDFDLHPNAKFLSCLGVAGQVAPTAHVNVKRGKFADTLTIEGNNFRPHLAFDMFTIQRSNLLANGSPDPNFPGNFGMAWYQSDLQANRNVGCGGVGCAGLPHILIKQILKLGPAQFESACVDVGKVVGHDIELRVQRRGARSERLLLQGSSQSARWFRRSREALRGAGL